MVCNGMCGVGGTCNASGLFMVSVPTGVACVKGSHGEGGLRRDFMHVTAPPWE